WKGDGNKYDQARAHLLGDQLGGSGKYDCNLFTATQSFTNNSQMKSIENQVRSVVEHDGSAQYEVYLDYGGTVSGAPTSVSIQNSTIHGQDFAFDPIPNPAAYQ